MGLKFEVSLSGPCSVQDTSHGSDGQHQQPQRSRTVFLAMWILGGHIIM